nr:MAG TPA: hypothetical protein [Caudoviricetes sp.]
MSWFLLCNFQLKLYHFFHYHIVTYQTTFQTIPFIK